MLYCADCQQFFEEEDAVTGKELIGEYAGAPAYKEYVICPHCGGDQIEEAARCHVCGAWKPDDAKDCCSKCYEDAYDMFYIMLMDIETRHSEATCNDVLQLMADAFDDFYNAKL